MEEVVTEDAVREGLGWFLREPAVGHRVVVDESGKRSGAFDISRVGRGFLERCHPNRKQIQWVSSESPVVDTRQRFLVLITESRQQRYCTGGITRLAAIFHTPPFIDTRDATNRCRPF